MSKAPSVSDLLVHVEAPKASLGVDFVYKYKSRVYSSTTSCEFLKPLKSPLEELHGSLSGPRDRISSYLCLASHLDTFKTSFSTVDHHRQAHTHPRTDIHRRSSYYIIAVARRQFRSGIQAHRSMQGFDFREFRDRPRQW